jgi:3-phenylpropionate/trans-cinnamate dioxygenase ferredoxin subunit
MASTTFLLDELESGTVRRVEVDGVPVAVVRIGDEVYAIGDVCSHANVSLSEGEVWADERELECPKHGSTFDLKTGEPVTLPATQPVPVYSVDVVDGQVTVTVEEASAR